MTTIPVRAAGSIVDVLGPVIRVCTDVPIAIGDVMWAGDEQLYSEVIALDGRMATLQVYESSSGLKSGGVVAPAGHALRVQLGPGLLGSVFDGLQRPLDALAATQGAFIGRGTHLPTLDPNRMWAFTPRVQQSEACAAGAVIGGVAETPSIEHRVMLPPDVAGRLTGIAAAGRYRVGDVVARVETADGREVAVRLAHEWPAREPRPFAARRPLTVPLVTGQRVLDTFFPVAAGGTVAMPGGFGTGKTVLQHQLCKWADADVIVFIGCGERGNEMAEALTDLPSLTDPRTGRPLSERTVLIANTSDMPVAAREASIYVGTTIGEYYRDMGYRVLLLADSTSRWAEALREISGRLEEMPAEEGYPSYLASRLAAFYERAGRVQTLGGREGSLTIVGAISPAGGDLTEPVTRHTERLARAVWSLDRSLAQARRFPAVSIVDSHSEGADQVAAWWHREAGAAWWEARGEIIALLGEAERLETTARLIGTSALPERQQLVLAFATLVEDAFLRQYAGETDDWCPPARQCAVLELLRHVARQAMQAVDRGVLARDVLGLPSIGEIRRVNSPAYAADSANVARLRSSFDRECEALAGTAERV